jgi:hypothetical protein
MLNLHRRPSSAFTRGTCESSRSPIALVPFCTTGGLRVRDRTDRYKNLGARRASIPGAGRVGDFSGKLR